MTVSYPPFSDNLFVFMKLVVIINNLLSLLAASVDV